MYRIDSSGNVPALPAPAALGTPGYFSGGNPVTATAPTLVTADWLNMIQEELCSIIAATSEVLDKTAHNQVISAIEGLINQYISASVTPVIGSVRNLKCSATNGQQIMYVAADEIIVGTALGGVTGKISNLNTALNVSTVGAGGMDVGAPPTSAGISVYAIQGPGMPDSVLGTVSGPTNTIYSGAHMPAGYTKSALVSAPPIMNSSAQFIGFTQYDREVFLAGLYLIASALTGVTTFTIQSTSVVIPQAAKTLGGFIQQTLTAAGAGVIAQPAAAGDTQGTGAQYGGATSTSSASGLYNELNFYGVPVMSPQAMFWRSGDTRASSVSIQLSSYKF